MMGGRPSEEEKRWQRRGRLRRKMQHTLTSREKTKIREREPNDT
jgi:hypothetical protein